MTVGGRTRRPFGPPNCAPGFGPGADTIRRGRFHWRWLDHTVPARPRLAEPSYPRARKPSSGRPGSRRVGASPRPRPNLVDPKPRRACCLRTRPLVHNLPDHAKFCAEGDGASGDPSALHDTFSIFHHCLTSTQLTRARPMVTFGTRHPAVYGTQGGRHRSRSTAPYAASYKTGPGATRFSSAGFIGPDQISSRGTPRGPRRILVSNFDLHVCPGAVARLLSEDGQGPRTFRAHASNFSVRPPKRHRCSILCWRRTARRKGPACFVDRARVVRNAHYSLLG